MYRDNSLMPSEAVRLLALGLLGNGALHYAVLASEVRHFTGRMVGPSLELVAQPLELLRLEGLIEPVDAGVPADEAEMQITDSGREELTKLLSANLRPQVNDLSKLIVALKVRFLHLLDGKAQRLQLEMLVDVFEQELARLTDLRGHHADEPGALVDWLEFEIGQTNRRLDWFGAQLKKLSD
ncbi:hypothetical protein ACTL6U_07450 [Rhodovibrionaceae bacterium A322]